MIQVQPSFFCDSICWDHEASNFKFPCFLMTSRSMNGRHSIRMSSPIDSHARQPLRPVASRSSHESQVVRYSSKKLCWYTFLTWKRPLRQICMFFFLFLAHSGVLACTVVGGLTFQNRRKIKVHSTHQNALFDCRWARKECLTRTCTCHATQCFIDCVEHVIEMLSQSGNHKLTVLPTPYSVYIGERLVAKLRSHEDSKMKGCTPPATNPFKQEMDGAWLCFGRISGVFLGAEEVQNRQIFARYNAQPCNFISIRIFMGLWTRHHTHRAFGWSLAIELEIVHLKIPFPFRSEFLPPAIAQILLTRVRIIWEILSYFISIKRTDTEEKMKLETTMSTRTYRSRKHVHTHAQSHTRNPTRMHAMFTVYIQFDDNVVLHANERSVFLLASSDRSIPKIHRYFFKLTEFRYTHWRALRRW